MLNTMYANPPAPLLTGNLLSSHFPVCRGSHQGCPLSALLFALSLEPLAQKNLSVTECDPCNRREHRSFHFVVRRWHFVLSRLWNAWFGTHSVSPHIIQHVFRFEEKSEKKRALLPLCNLSDYAVASFKYLGVHIASLIDKIINKNLHVVALVYFRQSRQMVTYVLDVSFILCHLEKWFSSKQSLPWLLIERSLVNLTLRVKPAFCCFLKQCEETTWPHHISHLSHSLTRSNTWATSGVHTLSDLIDNIGLRSFEDLEMIIYHHFSFI